MTAIKLITFDLDNTLWNVEAVLHTAERRMRDWLHERLPEFPERFPAQVMQELRGAVLTDSPDLRHDLSRLREEILYRAIVQFEVAPGDARRLANQAFHVFLDARHDVELFDGAIETLEALSGRYALGALTNGNADVGRLEIGRYFDFAYSAAAVGVGKPAPDMFYQALAHAGVAAGEAVHVGDNLQDDIEGARGIGMHTVWVNLHGHELPEHVTPPTRTVPSIAEVPASIDSITGRRADPGSAAR